MRFILLFVIVAFSISAFAQGGKFEFGRISMEDLQMKTYPLDTSAGAVVLNEFGDASINDSENHNLIFKYHVTIKILKRSGFDKANFVIPLFKDGSKEETLGDLEASTFNLIPAGIKETKMDKKAYFFEKTADYYSQAKFTLPDIKVGSIIEIRYTIESPFKFNFRPWEFQSDIPKRSSEYWASIPAVYEYNIALKGFLQLTKKESVISKDCFSSGSQKADCSSNKFVMENIPAFIEEDYMTAKSNFLSAIVFELAEVKWFDGTVNQVTREWRDVDVEFRSHENFGKQIRKAKGLENTELQQLVAAAGDSLAKANVIYEYIKNWYNWNGNYGKYSDTDTKKAYDTHAGNVGDINLSLIGILQAYDFNAEPVICSTRSNGLVTELYPVISQFNYVLARVKIGGKSYLLDATDPFLTFGMLPIRCLNGKGRLIGRKESAWVELKPLEKNRKVSTLALKLQDDGTIGGTLSIQSQGFEAMNTRKAILRKSDQSEYVSALAKEWGGSEITKYSVENLRELTKPLIEKMYIKLPASDISSATILYLSPFIADRKEENPFHSPQRLYPVDLGVAEETTTIFSIELPTNIRVEEAPANAAMQLPQGGGRFLVNTSTLGNKAMMTSVLSFNKAVYGPEEYQNLKEFYARVVQAHQGQYVFKKN